MTDKNIHVEISGGIHNGKTAIAHILAKALRDAGVVGVSLRTEEMHNTIVTTQVGAEKNLLGKRVNAPAITIHDAPYKKTDIFQGNAVEMSDIYVNAEKFIEPVDLWADNRIQFARLLAEIAATQDGLDLTVLAEAMSISRTEVKELFDRAQQEWETQKANIGIN